MEKSFKLEYERLKKLYDNGDITYFAIYGCPRCGAVINDPIFKCGNCGYDGKGLMKKGETNEDRIDK